MTIKNIVLDIGDVICEWNPSKLISGIFSLELEQKQALQDTIQHPDWLALDRGTLQVDEAINNAQNRSELDPDKIAQVYMNTPASLTPLPDSVAAIHEVHQANVPLFVLSNMQKESWEYMSTQFDFWSCFQGLVISYQIKLIKPEPEIFAHLLNTHNLNASETVFVDDTPVNIDAAKHAGLQGVVLSDRNLGGQVIRELLTQS